MEEEIITVESTLAGHPDKVCDQIAEAILDDILKNDPNARVAVEVMGTAKLLLIGGEVSTTYECDFIKIARRVMKRTVKGKKPRIILRVNQQSPEISKLANDGAGDSGMCYGYATDETPELMPWAIIEAHKKAREYFNQYKGDGKVQLTCKGKEILKEVSKLQGRDFELGGFVADTGLTGRKIQVDNYCGIVRQGGGSFAGKDPTKVDKSGTLWARFLARQIVKRHGGKALVRLSFEIGQPYPVEIWSDRPEIEEIKKEYNYTVKQFIDFLDLRKPIWESLACYGYFGREGYNWEK